MKQIQDNDFYQIATKKYLDTKFTKSLEKEFEILPYHLRYRAMYFTALIFTYFCNIFSFLSGSALLYFTFLPFMPIWAACTLVLGIAVMLETAKRKTCSEWSKNLFQFRRKNIGLLIVIFILSAISIIGSYFGAERSIKEFTPTYKNIELDSTESYKIVQSNIAQLRAEKKELQSQKNEKGQTYYKVLPAIATLSEQIATLENEALTIRQQNRSENTTAQKQHTSETEVTAENIAVVSLVCELLFILLSIWCKYYRFHSYRTLSALAQNVVTRTTNDDDNEIKTTHENVVPVTTNNDDNATKETDNELENSSRVVQLKSLKRKIQKKLNTNVGRLSKGIGKPETLRNNISTYKEQLKTIQQQLKSLASK